MSTEVQTVVVRVREGSASLRFAAIPRMFSAGAVVTAVWSTLTASLIACVVAYTRNIPLAEDWVLVPALTGHEAQFWRWLWWQNNEHRLPLPRLVLLGVIAPFRDFRAGMIASIVMIAAVSLLFVLALRRMRGGRSRYTDAFIPLVFLNLGHWENFFWAWELSFVMSAALASVVLLGFLVETEPACSSPWAWLVGVALMLLPLCGATGLVPALPPALWLAWQNRRSRRSVAFLTAVAALAVCGLYFVGYQRATWNPPSPGIRFTITTGLKCLALGLGPATFGRHWAAAIGAVLGSAGVVLLARPARSAARNSGVRAKRLLAFGVGVLGLALAIGWGRAGLVPTAGLPSRYALLMVPAFVLTYVAAELYTSAAVRRVVLTALFVCACALLPLNIESGLSWRDWYRDGMNSVELDLENGATAATIAARHERFLYPWNRETLIANIGMLRDSQIGPFDRVASIPQMEDRR
jgi:hypothetical protein